MIDTTISEYLIGFVASVVANSLSALAGGGSGLFLLPALLVLGIPFPIALASHKIATVGLGVGASLRHRKNAVFNYRFVVFLCATGIPAVCIGALNAPYIPENIARLGLGVLITSLAIINLILKEKKYVTKESEKGLTFWLIGGLGLFLIGFLNGSLTSGTGLLFTLWLVHWFGKPFMQALSYTMLTCSLIYNATGALILGITVTVNWWFILTLICGAIIGGFLGTSLSIKNGEKFVKNAFTVSCFVIGGFLLI